MKKILFNLGLVSGCLVFSVIHSQTQAQTRTVTGTVNNGEKPISGVVVSQEGSSQMTTTTDSGAFSLQITGETPILIFRHPEYGERKLDTDGKIVTALAPMIAGETRVPGALIKRNILNHFAITTDQTVRRYAQMRNLSKEGVDIGIYRSSE